MVYWQDEQGFAWVKARLEAAGNGFAGRELILIWTTISRALHPMCKQPGGIDE